MPKSSGVSLFSEQVEASLPQWEYVPFVKSTSKSPVRCEWYDELIRWFNWRIANEHALLDARLNPVGVVPRTNRHVMLVGPQKFGKSFLVSQLIGADNFKHRTYFPKHHGRTFMNSIKNSHKFIVYEDFNINKVIYRNLLFDLMDGLIPICTKDDLYFVPFRGPIFFICSTKEGETGYFENFMANLIGTGKGMDKNFRLSFMERVKIIDCNEQWWQWPTD